MTRRVLVAGETLIDFMSDEVGPLDEIDRFTRRAGGAPANVAVGCSRLGQPPWFWTRLGSDPFGEFLATTIRSNGVDDRFVERDETAPTGIAFVAHDAAGTPSFEFRRNGSADTRLEPGTVPTGTLSAVDAVVVGGLALSLEPARTAIFELVERASEAGCTIYFDPNARPAAWPDGGFEQTVRELLPLVDVCKASIDDLRVAGFDRPTDDLLDAVLGTGPHTVVVTRGADGATGRSSPDAPGGRSTGSEPAPAVDVVDTTGAGDAFLAGLVVADLDGLPTLQDRVRFASVVAGLTTTGAGAIDPIPDRVAVEERLES